VEKVRVLADLVVMDTTTKDAAQFSEKVNFKKMLYNY